MFRPRVRAGSPAGGQFAARARPEPGVSLADGAGWNELYYGLAHGLMPLEQRRLLARWSVRQAFANGTVDLMLGTEGAERAAAIKEAALSDGKLDAAVAALAAQEESSSSRVSTTSLGFHLCKQLLLAERDAGGTG